MDFMRAAIDASQRVVNGDVRVRLYKGNVIITGRRSPNSLYSEDLVTFEEDSGAYDQADATGFIRLQGLRLRQPD
jgi:argininosuccinate synthase